jgi:hypothetical protein
MLPHQPDAPFAELVVLGSGATKAVPEAGTPETPAPTLRSLPADPIMNERGDLLIEELDVGVHAQHVESVDLDLGVEPKQHRMLRRIGVAILLTAAAVSGFAFLRRSDDPTRSGRGVIARLSAQGPASMTLKSIGTLNRSTDADGTFDIAKAQAEFTLGQGSRTSLDVRRDGRTLYFSSPGSGWQAISLRSAIQGQSLSQLIVFPTDVLALVGLVPADGFAGRDAVNLEGVDLEHATFSVTSPTAYPTNLIDGDRLLDIIDDLKGPLTGEVWFDARHRLRQAVVRASSKKFDRDVEYTVTISEFGKAFDLTIPVVTEPTWRARNGYLFFVASSARILTNDPMFYGVSGCIDGRTGVRYGRGGISTSRRD